MRGQRLLPTGDLVSHRWPHIERILRVNEATGWVGDISGRSWDAEDRLSPAERAAAYEEWADFWEWRLAERTDELAGDRVKRHLVQKWTDDIAYNYRRLAALARGEDPGRWVSVDQRRPDLRAEGRAIVAEIIAKPDERKAG